MCRKSDTVCLIKSPVLDGVAGRPLVERLRMLPDPRRRRGVRHPFVAVLLVAASAVVAGAQSFAAMGQWAANAPQHALARLGARLAGALGVGDRSEHRHDPPGHRPGLPRRPRRSDRRRPRRLGLRVGGRQGRPRLPARQLARRSSPGSNDRRRPDHHPTARPRQDQRNHLLHRTPGALRPGRGHRDGRRAPHAARPCALPGRGEEGPTTCS
jgi:hypothetical protein